MKTVYYDRDSILNMIDNLIKNKSNFRVTEKAGYIGVKIGNKYYRQKPNATFNDYSSMMKAMSLRGNVRKSINKYLLKHDLTIDVVPWKHAGTVLDKISFSQMEIGDKFYVVDISHAYWRVAYKLGYISKSFYEKYAESTEPSIKMSRNMALSGLVSSSKNKYYAKGVEINQLNEDNALYRIVYQNIRYTTYNILGNLYSQIKENSYGYRIDGIFVKEESLKKAVGYFRRNGYKIKVVELMKTEVDKFADVATGEEKKF